MKKFAIFFLAFVLFGCGGSEDSKTPKVSKEKVETVGLGEKCDKKKCGAGLECNINKICIETVVDKNLECPETKAPVCAKKDSRKNGYLNKCEAQRHGAEFLYSGFCKKDEEVKNSCEAKVLAIGNCEREYIGFEFDGKKCIEKKVMGCDAELPFETKESCEKKCL